MSCNFLKHTAVFQSQYLRFDLLVVFTMLTGIFSHGFFSTGTVVVTKEKTRFEDVFYKIFNDFNIIFFFFFRVTLFFSTSGSIWPACGCVA